jgi:hypothetical protein
MFGIVNVEIGKGGNAMAPNTPGPPIVEDIQFHRSIIVESGLGVISGKGLIGFKDGVVWDLDFHTLVCAPLHDEVTCRRTGAIPQGIVQHHPPVMGLLSPVAFGRERWEVIQVF